MLEKIRQEYDNYKQRIW